MLNGCSHTFYNTCKVTSGVYAIGVDEAAVLILAIRRSNMPKFLLDDAVLFNAIISDLFPGMDVPEQVTRLQSADYV